MAKTLQRVQYILWLFTDKGSNLLAKLLEYFELRGCYSIALAQRSSKALSATGSTVS